MIVYLIIQKLHVKMENIEALKASERLKSKLNLGFVIILDESRIKQGGRIGMDDYIDLRQFLLESHEIKLIYLYLPTLIEPKSIETINFLKEIKNLTSIDILICASYSVEMNK